MSNLRQSKLKKKKREKRKKKRISHLPDDLWRKILDMGIENSKFTYKDLCSISITFKRLHRLSGEDSLWFPLLSSDFFQFKLAYRSIFNLNSPSFFHDLSLSSSSSSAKSRYKIKKLELQRKAEKEIVTAVLSKIKEIELTEQNEKRKPNVAEYFNLPKAKCNGYEYVPDRRYPREKKGKSLTRQRKCWYQ